jgi:4-aminobutyrate aminotransferase-like enzyme
MRPALRTEIPGPRSRALAARLRAHESRNVTFVAPDWPVFWARAEGTNVWDVDGNRFLDLTSAFGVAGLGHSAPPVVGALLAQGRGLVHAMGDVHPAEVKAELCARLSALTFERWGDGPGKVILGNSGSEAVEAALKTALLATGRRGVLAFAGGYHGLGFGALAAGGLPYFREPFRAQLADFATLAPYPHSEAELEPLRARLQAQLCAEQIGAVLVEPVQGRGGCVVPPPGFLPMLRALCDAHGALLVCDEIYTGFNRTGALFACEHVRTVPDLICLGKALTGGFPLSACVGRAAVMDSWPESTGEALHTSTHLGHPLGCAMALAALAEHTRPETAALVRERGEKLRAALETIAGGFLGAVRGLGLMLGVEIVDAQGQPDGRTALALLPRALRAGLLLLADGPEHHVLSFTPPFTISDEEIAFVSAWLAGERQTF